MTITARIIADSISPAGKRLTTMELRYPRFIHAEAKTHRVMTIGGEEYTLTQDAGLMSDPNLSRNASSSRAIPVEKMIQQVIADPAMPVYWGKNKPGMQAAEELQGEERLAAIRAWLDGMAKAVDCARTMIALGVHKQIANRAIEPWGHITVVVTATEWNNFFHLRDHADAQPEIRVLAQYASQAMAESTPVLLQPGQWHLPYVDVAREFEAVREQLMVGRITRDIPTDKEVYAVLLKLSTARCARTSYLTHDNETPVMEKDIELFVRLVGSSPLHASPTEHQATPDDYEPRDPDYINGYRNTELHGNLVGWIQHRKLLVGEFVPG